MQYSSSAALQPELILEWLLKEMGYQPQGKYVNSPLPSVESLRRIYRGNMIPVFNFLLQRVKSEKTVEKIRQNILVHGGSHCLELESPDVKGRKDGEKARSELIRGQIALESSTGISRESALRERDLAKKEVLRLRASIQRRRRELEVKMVEVAREEADRKRMLDESANYRHKQVILEAFSKQCDDAIKIFAEYHKRLLSLLDKAKHTQGPMPDERGKSSSDNDKALFSIVRSPIALDTMIVETTLERSIRQACEVLAARMLERVQNTFPAYFGTGIHSDPVPESSKFGFQFDIELPEDVRAVILNALKDPHQLLQAITAYTSKMKTLICKEAEKIDVEVDAERLRYKLENNRIIDIASPDATSCLPYSMCDVGWTGADIPPKSISQQLLQRRADHVHQFVATEDALNKAAEARKLSEVLVRRLHEANSGISKSYRGATADRHFELDVWAKEREAAGLRASVNVLTSEVQRLKKQCSELEEAEESLRKKWRKVGEFDARRSELEAVYLALLRANKDAGAFWEHQPILARQYASTVIVPTCTVVSDIACSAQDLISKEINIFSQTPDSSFYMLPSSSQPLIQAMGVSGSTGVELSVLAEKTAAILIARAGTRDPSAVPSICRISAALPDFAIIESSDTGLATVLKALEFCLKPLCSEASVLEDLWKAINLLHMNKNLVESGHRLLNHAHSVQQEFEETANYCLQLATQHEKVLTETWMPELKKAFVSAQTCLHHCKRVRGLIDEWWRQPAAVVVDWVTIDGRNVAAWLNYMKQLQMSFYDNELR